MDDTFDRFIKTLGASNGRRQVLALVRSGLIAAFFTRAALNAEAKPKKKKPGAGKRAKQRKKRTERRSGTATERASAAAGCQRVLETCAQDGDCCAGSTCRLGLCRCRAGYSQCGQLCFDLESTHDRCGACTTSCGAYEICVNGSCVPCPIGNEVCGDVCCPPFQTCCDGACVDDFHANPDHCGSCGNPCPRVCRLNPDGSADCIDRCCSEGVCVSNFQTDRENCGSCGHICRAGESCCGGECVDLETSDDQCGRCGNACRNGRVCCDGTCVDLNSEEHCGACGNACVTDFWTCCAGVCYSPRNHFCCDGELISVYNDDIFNCGACRRICPPGAMCCYGECCPMVYECDVPPWGCHAPS